MTKKERRRGRQGEGAVTMTELAMHMPKAYFRRRGRELRRRRVGEQPEGVTGVLLGAEYCLIRRLELHTFHWCARCLRDRMRSADGARDCLKAAMANQEILLLPPHIPASSLSNYHLRSLLPLVLAACSSVLLRLLRPRRRFVRCVCRFHRYDRHDVHEQVEGEGRA